MTTRSGADAADSGRGRPDPDLDAVMGERRPLINLTYRLLGSLAEAEDAVQETYARWYAMSARQQDAIESPAAWLTTAASRICLNLLRSAHARRETYVGEWIPEPLPEPAEWISVRPGGTAIDPADRVTLDESVSMAFLVMLQSMTPAERVAFILHDVFRYPFAEVAEITGRTPAACRQLASSARRRIREAQAPATHQPIRPASSGPTTQPRCLPDEPRHHRSAAERAVGTFRAPGREVPFPRYLAGRRRRHSRCLMRPGDFKGGLP
jgi:RNA polymerase sigma factor (sigma-70 family)